MAPATRGNINNNVGDEVDPHTKNYVDAAMNEIRQSLAALTTTIIAMDGQNGQMVNPGFGRQANQFSRIAKVESPKFQRDNILSESYDGEDEMLDEGENWGIDPLEFLSNVNTSFKNHKKVDGMTQKVIFIHSTLGCMEME
ncbi:hypothetical protein Tco_1363156 [Tanacetum coccineum]